MTINIEDQILEAQAINPQYVKEQIALLLYEKHILTLKQAAQVAEMEIHAFQTLMSQHEVPISYNETDLAHDLAVLPHIFPNKRA